MEVTRRASGLLLAEQAAVPATIREQLKRLDPDLALGCQPDDAHGCYVWRVFRRVGTDRPAVWVFDWRDEAGRPLPLTSRIVEEAASRRLDSRRPHPDPVRENDEADERDRRESLEMFTDDARQGFRRAQLAPCLPRGVSLRMARDKTRARGEGV